MYSQAFAIEPVRNPFKPMRDVALRDSGPKVLVIDAARRLIEATAGARTLLTDGTVLQRCFDRVAAATRADSARLVAALARAVSHGHARAVFEGAGERLEADLVAVHAEGKDSARIVMILKPALEERQQRLDAAEKTFGLTRAESRLLATLFEGCSVPQAADRLGVARSTARTHLQRVFDKTGVRRQGDLLRLVGCD